MRAFAFLPLCLLVYGCAQVPASSIILSDAIGRDIQSMSQAHAQFVNAYFDELEEKANHFINKVYAPALIEGVIKEDLALYHSSHQEDKDGSMTYGFVQGFINPDGLNGDALVSAQGNALIGMNYFYQDIFERIESKRHSLLMPIRTKRTDLLAAIQANYENTLKKNATITALLSSVSEVYATQDSALEALGVDPTLRQTLAQQLAGLSAKAATLQSAMDGKYQKLSDIEQKIRHVTEQLDQ